MEHIQGRIQDLFLGGGAPPFSPTEGIPAQMSYLSDGRHKNHTTIFATMDIYNPITSMLHVYKAVKSSNKYLPP